MLLFHSFLFVRVFSHSCFASVSCDVGFFVSLQINVAAEAAACAALANYARVRATSIEPMINERARLLARLADYAWLRPCPSDANLVLCRVLGGWSARGIEQALRKQARAEWNNDGVSLLHNDSSFSSDFSSDFLSDFLSHLVARGPTCLFFANARAF